MGVRSGRSSPPQNTSSGFQPQPQRTSTSTFPTFSAPSSLQHIQRVPLLRRASQGNNCLCTLRNYIQILPQTNQTVSSCRPIRDPPSPPGSLPVKSRRLLLSTPALLPQVKELARVGLEELPLAEAPAVVVVLVGTQQVRRLSLGLRVNKSDEPTQVVLLLQPLSALLLLRELEVV